MQISFSNDVLPAKEELRKIFIRAYNNVSPKCNDKFQRFALDATLDELKLGDGTVDSFWTVTVSCFLACPLEPLFGTVTETGRRELETLISMRDHLQVMKNDVEALYQNQIIFGKTYSSDPLIVSSDFLTTVYLQDVPSATPSLSFCQVRCSVRHQVWRSNPPRLLVNRNLLKPLPGDLRFCQLQFPQIPFVRFRSALSGPKSSSHDCKANISPN